ncbi:hypothetical protein ElyMa_001969300 [Elysia marginata]|uniref:TGF-beta family profile domain-containing protein n=1 Tax=Elysia marginata TaxID=1093978 RepID=A0AAV4F0G0_9GAST|nr:hypothetical protein ElyMa_001969300 [Elysia marginata]
MINNKGDIIVPPKLSNRTTPALNAPTPPRNLTHTSHALGSIVKRSTVHQLLVPPTIHPKNVHMNLMVPPTIHSAQKDASSGSPSSQVRGILSSKPRVLCYADQPVERDVPCPANHHTALNVQHMQGLLKALGGSSTVQLNTSAPTAFNDTDNGHTHKSVRPEEQEKLNKILLEISLQVNQRMLSSLQRQSYTDLQAVVNEIVALTDAVFKYLFSVYTENYVVSLFNSIYPQTGRTYNANHFKSKGWQSLLTAKDTSKDFATNVEDYNNATKVIRHFYQAFLNTSNKPEVYRDLINNIEQEIDFKASQIVYSNLKSAIQTLKTIYSLIELATRNATDINRSSAAGDFQTHGKNQLIGALNTYVKSFELYENIQSDSNQNFSLQTFQMASNDTESTLRRVTKFLQFRVDVLGELMDEGSVELAEHQKNMQKLKTLDLKLRRKRRDIIGTSDMTCQNQGERIGGSNLLNLCSTCVQTTVLSEEFFPRYITEKICQPDSLSAPSGPRLSQQGCLYQPGQAGTSTAAGLCREQYFHINILKRVPGKCMKVQLDGKEVITDLWELTMHPLRVGCECAVDENSRFAQFVNKN